MRLYGTVATLQDTGNIQVTGLEYGRDRKINTKSEGVSLFLKKIRIGKLSCLGKWIKSSLEKPLPLILRRDHAQSRGKARARHVCFSGNEQKINVSA
jgi:hypothetical protein